EVDVVEHELPEREHRVADLRALPDVTGGLRCLNEVVHERVDSVGAGLTEKGDFLLWQVLGPKDPEADRVVDVVVDVCDAVDDADDLPLERRRLALARVREDAVAHLLGEVQLFGDPERLLVVAEPATEALREGLVQRLLSRMAEGWMTHVVTESDRLDKV